MPKSLVFVNQSEASYRSCQVVIRTGRGLALGYIDVVGNERGFADWL